MELTDFKTLKATKKVKIIIYELEERLLKMQDALDDMARACEIAQVTEQHRHAGYFCNAGTRYTRG